MTQPRSHKLVLTGPYTGKTKRLQGHLFDRGVLKFYGTAAAVEGLVTYMGRSYQAYLEGSDELRAAQDRDDAAYLKEISRETADGERDIQGEISESEGTDPGDGDVQSEGSGSSETPPDDGTGAGEDPEGSEGDVSDRDGHEDPRVPDAEAGSGGPVETSRSVNVALQNAVYALDPENNGHWTGAGLPAMTVVEHVYGSADITRRDVEIAAPGYDRDAAHDTHAVMTASESEESEALTSTD